LQRCRTQTASAAALKKIAIDNTKNQLSKPPIDNGQQRAVWSQTAKNSTMSDFSVW